MAMPSKGSDNLGPPLTMRMEVEKVFATALDSILAKKQSSRRKSLPGPERAEGPALRGQRAGRESGVSSSSASPRRRHNSDLAAHSPSKQSPPKAERRRRSTDESARGSSTGKIHALTDETTLNETVSLSNNTIGLNILSEVASMRKDLEAYRANMEMALSDRAEKATPPVPTAQHLRSRSPSPGPQAPPPNVATRHDLANLCHNFAGRRSLDDLKTEVSCLHQRMVSQRMEHEDLSARADEGIACEANSLRKDVQEAIQTEREARIAESTEMLLVLDALREGLARTNAAVEAATEPETLCRILMGSGQLSKHSAEIDKVSAMAGRLEEIASEFNEQQKQQQQQVQGTIDVEAIAAKVEASVAVKMEEMTAGFTEQIEKLTRDLEEEQRLRRETAERLVVQQMEEVQLQLSTGSSDVAAAKAEELSKSIAEERRERREEAKGLEDRLRAFDQCYSRKADAAERLAGELATRLADVEQELASGAQHQPAVEAVQSAVGTIVGRLEEEQRDHAQEREMLLGRLDQVEARRAAETEQLFARLDAAEVGLKLATPMVGASLETVSEVGVPELSTRVDEQKGLLAEVNTSMQTLKVRMEAMEKSRADAQTGLLSEFGATVASMKIRLETMERSVEHRQPGDTTSSLAARLEVLEASLRRREISVDARGHEEQSRLKERLEQEREHRTSENAAILTRMEELCRLNAESTSAMRSELEMLQQKLEKLQIHSEGAAVKRNLEVLEALGRLPPNLRGSVGPSAAPASRGGPSMCGPPAGDDQPGLPLCPPSAPSLGTDATEPPPGKSLSTDDVSICSLVTTETLMSPEDGQAVM